MRARAVVLAVLLTACGDNRAAPPHLTVFASSQLAPLVTTWAEPLGDVVVVERVADPVAAARAGTGVRVAVTASLDCRECYEIDRLEPLSYQVSGDAPLGVQYGLSQLAEGLGVRFVQPDYTHLPSALVESPALAATLGVRHQPAMARRGLHLHTLHPIEAYDWLWEPSDAHRAEADRLFSWIVANRGNYVQWSALDDILAPARGEPWRAYTKQLIADAHARGLEVGMGLELFGSANLQHSYDLVDDENQPLGPQIAERFGFLADGLDLQVFNLSFGEFFGADPDAFIDAVNQAFAAMKEVAPDAEMLATIHVGDSPDQHVEYDGQDLIYYFLVQFADPAIVSLVHTVMYYDLYEDAGGAYHHDDFGVHRQYILDRLARGAPVGYFPETAYWVAFDDSIPLYLPLYVRSRWLDLDRLAADAAAQGSPGLDTQILFSTGWAWGYWQNDMAGLRASYERPARWQDFFAELFAAWGDTGEKVADLVVTLAEVERRGLIDDRLASYLAGRDFYIDVGDKLDIISQPRRVTLSEQAALDMAGRAAFDDAVATPLARMAAALAPLAAQAAVLATDDPVIREVIDGVLVTDARTRFALAAIRAVDAHATGDDSGAAAAVADLDAAYADGKAVVARRHGELFFPEPARLTGPTINSTLYPYGYLEMADTLCYWERERVEVERVLADDDRPLPNCIM